MDRQVDASPQDSERRAQLERMLAAPTRLLIPGAMSVVCLTEGLVGAQRASQAWVDRAS